MLPKSIEAMDAILEFIARYEVLSDPAFYDLLEGKTIDQPKAHEEGKNEVKVEPKDRSAKGTIPKGKQRYQKSPARGSGEPAVDVTAPKE